MSAAKSIPSASRIHEGPQTVPLSTLLSAVGAAAAERAVSNETHRAYGRALRQVTEQLAGRTLDDQGLSEALSELVAEGAGRAKLSQIIAAVRFGARFAGQPDPVGPSCDVVLRAHRRAAPPARQVAAVDWEHADAAADAAASTGDAIGLRNAAVIAVMSDALLRVSETAALQVGDIKCRRDGAATLTVPRSKTDQYGDRATLYLGATTILRIETWTSAAHSAGTEIASGPLFRRIRRGQKITEEPLSTRNIREIVRRAATAVGIDGASGHSLRVGSAVSLVRAGASLLEAQQAGRWVNPSMPAHYARNEIAARGAVARLRYDAA